MSEKSVKKRLKEIANKDRGTTHWEGCEDEHDRCFLFKLLDQKDRDHEALIGVLGKVVEKAEIVKTERDGCLTKNTLITCKAIDELCEALSHPLVQEYLKKEKT